MRAIDPKETLRTRGNLRRTRRKARQKGEVERRHTHRRCGHLVYEAHQGAHFCAHDRIARREACGRGRDLVEVFDRDT